ncbi:MAG TPA: acyl-CoA dehydrogenase family protein [Ilumatobacter sp.]|nr:acyl-CoA dehydrogenase family protein [Ilumatobacter sp.]
MSDDVEAFRASALSFLTANSSRRTNRTDVTWGVGDDAIGLLDGHADRAAEATALELGRAWRRLVFDSGFGWLGGPTALGGGGRSPVLDEEYRLLERQFDVPDQQPFATGTHLVAPAVLANGSEDVQRRYLPGLFRGDLLACQLLSEPEAGSDLAGLRTRAHLDGESWIVSGQKVWTSQAHLADVGQLLARTDPDAPKHRGLTMFLIDMRSPGVTVRPLRQMTGETHFNEVFLDDVRVPDANRVGPLGSGWGAVMATLMAERAAVGSGAANSAVDPVARLVDLARHCEMADDRRVRQRLAVAHTNAELRRFLGLRMEATVPAGRPTGAEGSILKLLFSDQGMLCGDIAGDLLGAWLTADTGAWGTFAWTRWVTGAPMLRVAGGTDEIQRNTLAERVLGLPKEPTPKESVQP